MTEKKTAGVIRVSSRGQTKADRYGRHEQRQDIESRQQGLDRAVEDIIWFDFQESATDSSKREQFQDIIGEIVQLRDAGVIDTVIFGRPDRLGRDGEDWFITYLKKIEGYGTATVRFGRDDVDPLDPFRTFKLFLLSFKSKQDALTIKENTRRGRISRATVAGKLATGSKALFGYTYNPQTGKREKDPETNNALRFAGELALEGKGTRQISKLLWEVKGVRKSYSSIRDVLHNPAICGRTVSRWTNEDGSITEIPLPDVTPPTFTPEEWEQIQTSLEETGKRLHRWEGKQKRHFYPLSGTEMILYSHCGHHMSGASHSDRGRSRRIYTHTGRYWPCRNPYKSWPAHKLEAIVWDRVLKFFQDPGEVRRKLAKQINQGRVSEVLENELKRLNDLNAQSEEAKTRLTEAWMWNRISPEKYYENINQIESAEASRGKRLQEIQQELDSMRNVDLRRLDAIILEIAEQTAGNPDWHLVSDELDSYMDQNCTTWEREFKFEDGTRYTAVEPDHSIGRQIWEARQKTLRDLNIRVYVDGRDVRVIFLAPILRVDQRTFTNTSSFPSWATMSISPQGHR